MSSALPIPEAPPGARPAASRSALGVGLALIEAMRPVQWQKNLLLYAAFIFSSGQWWDAADLGSWLPLLALSTLGFCLFSMAASGMYLLNDIIDVERDRAHPRKRYRAIASGRLPMPLAGAVGAALVGASVLVGAWADREFALVLLGYVALTLLYSVALKHVAIVDVLVVATGFALRAMAGAVVIEVPITEWLYIVTTFGALFLATLRRRQEWLLARDAGLAARSVIGQYSGEFLEQVTSLAMTSTVIAYAMYLTTADNLPPDHTMLITLPSVVYGLLRMRLIADRMPERNIDEMLMRDRLSLLNILLFAGASLLILLLHR